jgi:hypothetical protein
MSWTRDRRSGNGAATTPHYEYSPPHWLPDSSFSNRRSSSGEAIARNVQRRSVRDAADELFEQLTTAFGTHS